MLAAAAAICVALAKPYDGDAPALLAPKLSMPAFASTAAAFVPEGWRVDRELRGDLNRDGRVDLVAVLKGNDPRCVVQIDDRSEPLDTNPRMLLVAFGSEAGFRLLLANSAVIPRVEDPYMDDPLNDLAIRGGVLRLGLSSWRSMGGWTTFSSTLSFRWDGRRMRLIGFDRETLQRNTGETETLSVNYSTGRARVVIGSMQDDVADSTRWRQVAAAGVTLETIGDGMALEPDFSRD